MYAAVDEYGDRVALKDITAKSEKDMEQAQSTTARRDPRRFETVEGGRNTVDLNTLNKFFARV